MSKWIDFRDKFIESIRPENVTEQTKEDFSQWLREILLPMLRPYADAFIAQVREQAAAEAGWLKVRDLIVLPLAVEAGLWIVDKVLTEAGHQEQGQKTA